MKRIIFLFIISAALLLPGCSGGKGGAAEESGSSQCDLLMREFSDAGALRDACPELEYCFLPEKLLDGQRFEKFTLTNQDGLTACYSVGRGALPEDALNGFTEKLDFTLVRDGGDANEVYGDLIARLGGEVKPFDFGGVSGYTGTVYSGDGAALRHEYIYIADGALIWAGLPAFGSAEEMFPYALAVRQRLG